MNKTNSWKSMAVRLSEHCYFLIFVYFLLEPKYLHKAYVILCWLEAGELDIVISCHIATPEFLVLLWNICHFLPRHSLTPVLFTPNQFVCASPYISCPTHTLTLPEYLSWLAVLIWNPVIDSVCLSAQPELAVLPSSFVSLILIFWLLDLTYLIQDSALCLAVLCSSYSVSLVLGILTLPTFSPSGGFIVDSDLGLDSVVRFWICAFGFWILLSPVFFCLWLWVLVLCAAVFSSLLILTETTQSTLTLWAAILGNPIQFSLTCSQPLPSCVAKSTHLFPNVDPQPDTAHLHWTFPVAHPFL